MIAIVVVVVVVVWGDDDDDDDDDDNDSDVENSWDLLITFLLERLTLLLLFINSFYVFSY